MLCPTGPVLRILTTWNPEEGMKFAKALFPIAIVILLAGCPDPEPEPQGSQAKILLAQADAVFKERKYTEARAAYEKAAATAATSGDVSVQIESLSQVARIYSVQQQLSEGRAWLERAEGVATPEHPLGWTRYLGVRGIFERELGKQEGSLATFMEMYDYAMEKGLPLRAIDAAHHAAIVAPLAEQVAWAERGIAAAEAAKDKGWLAVLWNNLGATYESELKDYPLAVECYEKARVYHYETGRDQQKLAADWALGKALLLNGDPDRAAGFLGDASKAAAARHAKSPTLETTEWIGHTEQWQGELLVAGGKVTEGLYRMRAGRQALVDAGIGESWPEGLAALDARIAELEAGQAADGN